MEEKIKYLVIAILSTVECRTVCEEGRSISIVITSQESVLIWHVQWCKTTNIENRMPFDRNLDCGKIITQQSPLEWKSMDHFEKRPSLIFP